MGNQLICFVGIDGSGKTTCAKKLVDVLDQRQIKSKYVYNQFNGILSKPFMIIGKIIFLSRKNLNFDYDDYKSKKKKLLSNNLFSIIYYYSVMIDYFIQTMFRVNLRLKLIENVICDRYVYDVVVNLAIDMDYSLEDTLTFLNSMLKYFHTPDFVFLIDIPENIAYKRKNDVPSIDYLKNRRNIYLEIGKKHDFIVLDGSKKVDNLKWQIEKELMQKI